MKRLKTLMVVGLAFAPWLVGFPGHAYGQGNTWPGLSLAQMVERARWRLGPLHINSALELLNAGYDSDIYFGYLGAPVPDITFTAGLPVQILLPLSRKVVLDFYENPQYLFYASTERERAWNNVFRGQMHIALEKLYFQAGGGLSNMRTRLSPELDVNVREKIDRLNGSALWQTSQRSSLAVIFERAIFKYGEPEAGSTVIADALNRDEDSLDMVGYYQPAPRVRLFIDGRYETYKFPEPTASARDAQSYGIFAGFELTPVVGEEAETARFQGSFSLGYQRFDLRSPLMRDDSGLAGDITLSGEFMRRTIVRAEFAREFQFSIYPGASYFIATTYGGGFTRRLSRRLSVSYDLLFGKSDYPEYIEGMELPPISQYTTHSAAMDMLLSRDLTVRLLGTFRRRVVDQTDLAKFSNFVGISVTYGSPAVTISAPTGAPHR